MAAAHENERSPLLPSSSSLNPRAASFNFTPKDRVQATAPVQPQAQVQSTTAPTSNGKHDATAPPTGSTTRSYAAAAAAPPPHPSADNGVSNAIHEHPPTDLNGAAQTGTTGQPKQHSHSSSTTSFTTSPQSILHHPLPSASSLTPLSRPRSRTSSISSHSSNCSSTSSSSCYSLPSLSTFTHSHLLQFFLSTLLCLLLLALLVWWKHEIRYAELLLGAAAWLAGEGAKETVFDIFGPSTLEVPSSAGGEEEGSPSPTRRRRSAWAGRGLGVPTVVHALLQEALRLGAIVCMVALLPSDDATPTGIPPPRPPPPSHGPRAPLPPLDILFFSALWMALGWAIVEIVWGNRDFWRRMKLYDEVLAGGVVLEDEDDEGSDFGDDDEDEEATPPTTSNGYSYGTTIVNGTPEFLSSSAFDRVIEGRAEGPAELAREQQVEEEMEARVREMEREEIEAQLGVPLYEIPVAVVFVWRLDSILLSLVLTLLLSLPFRTTSPSLIPFPLWPTFASCALLHSFLSLLWCLRIKYVGIPSISYATLVTLVFLLFATLAAWGALE
ncbi:hypothetical protein BCR35DRAFT_300218 [Leucosporidium creatinivorum]|uniref:Uncharacterized protein n=1 Tax=Leucosporidium creatinivorum TaxID=106004 RepID=A0A1Y2G1S5_9BASI|nr:hypothetical protein BCR35DRAFT_300218 [Leucosporidium creatinivorum]